MPGWDPSLPSQALCPPLCLPEFLSRLFFPGWHQSLQCHPLAVPRRGDKALPAAEIPQPPESHPASPNSPKSHPRRACGPVQVTEGRAGRGVAKDGQEPASQRSAPRGKNGHGPQGSKRSLALSLSPLLLLRLLKTQHLPENRF